ncbi:hypothetical protein B0A55_05876 [Friedmanniomyces simplex]|uniref:Amidohydrolase-related domain-containing protein n=1 Tax=Friedmanniomyces simplex TaxID=329884 RepID=A0A4U0XIH5_9PEZI|nr:hypothetical protein B0A55_05876 [Friedmanniomyces simplex]
MATLLCAARVFDGHSFTEPKDVIIRDGTIESISSHTGQPHDNAVLIDADGQYLVPGFIDCHVHIRDQSQLAAHANHGVTTVLDMGSWPASLVDSFRGLPGMPDYLAAGPPAFPPGGHAAKSTMIPRSFVVGSEDDAVGFVRSRVMEKTDYVKIICEDDCDPSPIRKLASEAKLAGKTSIAHTVSTKTFQLALEADVDVITHAPLDDDLSEALVAAMKRSGKVSVPTLVMMQAVAQRPKKLRPADDVQHAVESVRRLHAAGVPILAGTDSNEGVPGGPAEVKHGESYAVELRLLESAGLTPLEVLQSATSWPAEHLGLRDRGSVVVGNRADLVLLAENPLTGIAALQKIASVWCHGVQVRNA